MAETKTAAQEAIEQYDLGDVPPHDPKFTLLKPSATTEGDDLGTPPARPTPPKDPVTGKFVSASKSTHNATLLATARKLGISDEEIEASTSADLRELCRDVSFAQEMQRRENTISTAIEKKQEQIKATKQAIAQAKLFDKEEEFDGELIGLLKKQQNQIEELKARLDRQDQEQAGRSFAAKADAAFESLGPKFEKLFGKGRGKDLDPQGPEMRKRRIIVREAAEMAGPNPTPEKILAKIKEAAGVVYGITPAPGPVTRSDDGGEPPARKKGQSLESFEQDWANGGLARPTGRNGGVEPKGKTKAIRSVEQFYRDRAEMGETVELDEDDFPG